MRSCNTCEYFLPAPTPTQVGECRRFPPQLVQPKQWSFTILKELTECGEYQHKRTDGN